MAYNLWNPRSEQAQGEGSHPGIFRASGGRKSLPFGSPKGSPKARASLWHVTDSAHAVSSPEPRLAAMPLVEPPPCTPSAEWLSYRTSKCLPDPDAVVETTAGWLYSGMPHPHLQTAAAQTDEERIGCEERARGYHSVPVPSWHSFKPSFKDVRESPSLSDSTTSPVWSARSAEVLSSQESTPAMGQRVPSTAKVNQTQSDHTSSVSESSDTESAVPRSISSTSLRDECEMTPRSTADEIGGQRQMPTTFPAPHAVPWAAERPRLSDRPKQGGHAEDAFAGLLMDHSGDQVSEITLSLPAPRSPKRNKRSSCFRDCISSSAQDAQDGTAQCIEQVIVSSDSDAQTSTKLTSDSELTTTFASCASLSDSDEDRARMHTLRAREMKGILDGELRSIDDEMQEIMQDLLRLKDHVAAAKPVIDRIESS
eukprot:gnl/MRDRNA2_/MRDRNA2_106784_c0_seq1.p1 gnl/MRDRNA2_/MRDRNA2_106784_c0~~gnl/MRDRNA2_/MRDRNA2_106784_c0_seq1.p1  ORF type:complete len:425 (+),score=71.42 gnl/MRDRNA2_/MRDRNA2_106784_c0_seq1:77-1351(+)